MARIGNPFFFFLENIDYVKNEKLFISLGVSFLQYNRITNFSNKSETSSSGALVSPCFANASRTFDDLINVFQHEDFVNPENFPV